MTFQENSDCNISQNALTHKCFVYFLIDGAEVVYVGKTVVGLCRPLAHTVDKKFDSINMIFTTEDKVGELEKYYIYKYLPKYNKESKPKKPPKEKQKYIRKENRQNRHLDLELVGEMLDVKQTAQRLGKTERTIMRWIYTEYIKAHKIGGMWEIPDDEVKRIKEGKE